METDRPGAERATVSARPLQTWLGVAGALSLVGGLLYLAGPVRNPWMLAWGGYAAVGGLAALAGARALARCGDVVPHRLLRAALIGFFLLLCGQLPPITGYLVLPRLMPGAFPRVLAPLGAHLLLAGVCAAGLAAAGRAVCRAGGSLAAAAGWALLATAAGAASPLWVLPLSLAAWSAAWPVKADPPPRSVVPASAAFRFTWPAWLGGGTGGAAAYAGVPPTFVHASVEGGPGFLAVTPLALDPGRTLVVEVASGLRRRRFAYRVAPLADDRVALYRAVLAHWFREPQAGFPRWIGFVVLDETGMRELATEDKRAVALGLKAVHPWVGLGDRSTAAARPITVSRGSFAPPPEPRPGQDALYLRLQAGLLPQGDAGMRVEATRIGSDGRVRWARRAVYRAERRDGAWRFALVGGSEDGRPWGEGVGSACQPPPGRPIIGGTNPYGRRVPVPVGGSVAAATGAGPGRTAAGEGE